MTGLPPTCGATFYPNIVITYIIQTFDYQKSKSNIEHFQRLNCSFVVIISGPLTAVFHLMLRLRVFKGQINPQTGP